MAGQIVEQVGVPFVVDIVEVDKTADDVILESLLFHSAFAEAEYFGVSSAEELHPELVGNRLKVEAGEIEIEGLEPRFHFALRHAENTRDVNGLLND